MSTNLQNKVSNFKILNPPFNDIAPFFSAVVYEKTGKISIEKIARLAKVELRKENQDTKKHYYYFKEKFIEGNLGLFIISHKSIPSWLLHKRISHDQSNFPTWENYQVHLAIIYVSKGYVFLSVQDKKVMQFFQNGINRIEGHSIKLLEKKNFQKSKAFKGKESKIIGLKNALGFGAAGKIPESKSYTGKNCSRSLNNTTDGVFKLSHIGSTNNDNTYSGASMKKRKIWGGWADSVSGFIDICDEHVATIEGGEHEAFNHNFDCLAQPKSVDLIKGKKPILFRMESWVKGRGLVCIKTGEDVFPSWNIEIPQFDKDCILLKIPNKEKSFREIPIVFEFDDDGLVHFSYRNENDRVSVVFQNEDSLESRGRDLIKYLTSFKNYSFLFSGGVSYSDNECYSSDKLADCFFDKSKTEISWKGVDITKEDRRAEKPNINILERLQEYYINQPRLLFGINDNGANEVADLILVFEHKLVFIHAKYSKNRVAGLRVGDLQEVVSQAVKNVNFSTIEPYTNQRYNRLYNNQFINRNDLNKDEFVKLFHGYLENPNISKEVCIVQPGISKSKLEEKNKNKIHTLLSYTEVVLNAAQIDFSFYCDK